MLAFVITVVLGYGLDRLTKIWVERTIPLNHSVNIIPPYLSFTHFENAGAAFSLLQGRLLLFIVVGVLASVAVVTIAVRNRKANSTGVQVVLGMLLSGILGDLTGRIIYHHVTDFIHFSGFAIFNVADSLIVTSVVLLFFRSFRSQKERLEA